MPAPAKVKRKRRVLLKPLPIIVGEGETRLLHDPMVIFAESLKASQPEVLASLKELILSELDGKTVNEAAKVTAATKVLDLLSDKTTPGDLLAKLELLRHDALDALRDVVNLGAVAAARANAGAYLLKAIKAAAPEVWPPDTAKEEWSQRMKAAVVMGGVPEATPS